jgi:hypothetical protein
MDSEVKDDPILRENRRSAVARRLISHGVRTRLITKLTGLTRNRLATVRRRLLVRDKTRRRGPTKSSLELFLGTPRARAEAAALATLCGLFEIPIKRNCVAIPGIVSLNFTERLCETYEAYRACFPKSEIELEELILLRTSLAKGDDIRLAKCRSCGCLMLVDPFDGNHVCPHCEPHPQADSKRIAPS